MTEWFVIATDAKGDTISIKFLDVDHANYAFQHLTRLYNGLKGRTLQLLTVSAD